MKRLLAKYGQYFWLVSLAVTVSMWIDLIFRDGELFLPIMFSLLTYYFFLKGTGRLPDEKDPFSG
tara:strand:+ start:355 stop:549 length:195 start_codon:yes stop_codon:yes gene_type:complete